MHLLAVYDGIKAKVSRLSVVQSIHRSSCILLLCCLVFSPAAAQNTVTVNSQPASPSLTFLRAFSSADDVRGPLHPVLDRTLDIIAGSKDAAPRLQALQSPSAVTTDSNGRLFVADPGAKAVHIFDFLQSKYSLLDKGSDRVGTPVSLAFDAQDNLYVTDDRSRTILVFDSAGKFRRSLGKLSGEESYFESPRGIAIDPATGHLYICDTHRHMLIMMDDRGRLIAKLGKRGGGNNPGDFKLPTQAVVAGGELFVLDVGNTRIQIFDTSLHFRRAISVPYADHRTGLAVDGLGNIYVSDPVLNQIRIFRERRPQYIFDPSQIKETNFSHPSAMWVHAGSCLYVVDSQSNRIGLFQIGGENTRQCR
jgi:DNA-binding beta-propeller fold protein YncE